MLMYREAEACFLKAEKLLDEPKIQRELLLLYYLAGNTRQYERLAEGFSEEELQQLVQRWDELRKNVKIDTGRDEAVIERWKQEYRREMT